MEDKKHNKRTEISSLGKFGLIERLMGNVGDDAVVVGNRSAAAGDNNTVAKDAALGEGTDTIPNPNTDPLILLSSKLLLEGVDFDLTYFPLRHLGYKTVSVVASGILAMNGTPTQITLSLGVSAKLAVEDLDDFYAGARAACEELGAELTGGDITASINGLAISANAAGTAPKNLITHRSGAHANDLICITRDLGAAYLGLHLLEREKRALADVANPRPKFDGYEYLLERQLKPRARKDVIDALAAEKIVPTSMTEISDGLASDLLQICKASNCGARIYLDRLPIARETYSLAEELHLDPVVAALNGGDDHELLFTVPLELRDRIMQMGLGIETIGHITPVGTGAALVTPDGENISLKAQGHK